MALEPLSDQDKALFQAQKTRLTAMIQFRRAFKLKPSGGEIQLLRQMRQKWGKKVVDDLVASIDR